MKALLVSPPAPDGFRIVREGRCEHRTGAWSVPWAPLSLALGVAYLRRAGHEAEAWDCAIEGKTWNWLKERISLLQPAVLIINAATPTIDSDLKTAALAKEAAPESLILAMGVHASAMAEELLDSTTELDGVIIGEPEETLVAVLDAVSRGDDPRRIAGISSRDEAGRACRNEPADPLDLSELPFPAWDEFDLGNYRLPLAGRRLLLVTTGRGCSAGCRFCTAATYYGRRVRLRPPSEIVSELAWLRREFGVRDVLFWAECFTQDREWVMELCSLLKEDGAATGWSCGTRADMVDAGMLREMKEAGCWMISFGIESGSQRVLDLMGKGLKLGESQRAVKLSDEAGIMTAAGFVLGFPGETPDEAAKTIELSLALPLDFAQFYCAVPFPGSSLFRDLAESGHRPARDWRSFEQKLSVVDGPGMTAAEAMDWRRKAIRRFYSRPSQVTRLVGRRRLVKLRQIAGALWRFRDWAF